MEENREREREGEKNLFKTTSVPSDIQVSLNTELSESNALIY